MRREQEPDWLGLGAASRVLGVSPETLRRWSDAGRVHTFTTPGGHRRYRRSTLERLVPAEVSHRPSMVRAGVTPARLSRAYRAQARAAAHDFPWLVALDDQQRDWFRSHGRLLAEALLAHLDAGGRPAAEHHLAAAATEATAYGRMTASLGMSLGQAVEGFLQFRRPFLHELVLAARRRAVDTTATTELLELAERAMDRLLMAAMTAHGTSHGAAPGGSPDGAMGRIGHGSERRPLTGGVEPVG